MEDKIHTGKPSGDLFVIEHQTPTLRDRFAMAVIPGLFAHYGWVGDIYNAQHFAEKAYSVADAMLAARGNQATAVPADQAENPVAAWQPELLKREIERLKDKIEFLEQQNRAANKYRFEARNEVVALEHQLTERTADYVRMAEDNQDLRAENAKLREELEIAVSARDHWTRRTGEVGAELEAMRLERDNIAATFEAHKQLASIIEDMRRLKRDDSRPTPDLVRDAAPEMLELLRRIQEAIKGCAVLTHNGFLYAEIGEVIAKTK
jgi:chromosome segregation ATPase